MGEVTADEAAPHYTRIVRDYPLSEHVEEAKGRLAALGSTIPEADPAAVARMTYENTHGESPGLFDKMMGAFRRRPNVSAAQGKTAFPTMTAQGPAQAGAFPNGSQTAASGGASGVAPGASSPSSPTIVFESLNPASGDPPPAGSSPR